MSDSNRVVLAPDAVAEYFPAEFAVEIRQGNVDGEQLVSLRNAEARHLRDLLCEWFGLPEGVHGEVWLLRKEKERLLRKGKP